ncbi:MAG: GIDE domain-containing protein, partial [Pseudanabaenaceae cyanobacterium]
PTYLTLGGMNIPLGLQPGECKVVKGHTYKESAIVVGSRLYVLGEARVIDNQVTIAKPSNPSDPFLISVKSEEEIVSQRQQNTTNALVGAIAGSVLGLICLLAGLAGR